KHRAEYENQTYYFCSRSCHDKFVADPQQYVVEQGHGRRDEAVSAVAAAPSQPSPAVYYTCPMHPEVRQVGPGNCPKCGMALEPLMPADEEDTSELAAVRRKLAIGVMLAVPLVLVAMGPHL